MGRESGIVPRALILLGIGVALFGCTPAEGDSQSQRWQGLPLSLEAGVGIGSIGGSGLKPQGRVALAHNRDRWGLAARYALQRGAREPGNSCEDAYCPPPAELIHHLGLLGVGVLHRTDRLRATLGAGVGRYWGRRLSQGRLEDARSIGVPLELGLMVHPGAIPLGVGLVLSANINAVATHVGLMLSFGLGPL